MIYRTYYLSPLGRILLAADDIGLIGVWFEGQKYFGEFPGHMDFSFEENENHILKDALRWLDIYFSGQKPDFLPKLHLIGTDFQREVWDILLEIPYGQTVTYGEIARKIADKRGLKTCLPRQLEVRLDTMKFPLSFPASCDSTNGSLTGYAGGIDKKLSLLELEHADMSYLFVPKKGTAL